MKDFDKVQKDEIKTVTQKQVEKRKVHLGSAMVRPGHRCFEINKDTLEVSEVEYNISATFNNGVKKEINIKENCAYIIALNKKNALKKFNL